MTLLLSINQNNDRVVMAQSYRIAAKEQPFAGANSLSGELVFPDWDDKFTRADEIEVELLQGRTYSPFSKVNMDSIEGIFHGQDAAGNIINLVPGENGDVIGTLSDIVENQIFFIKTVNGVQIVEGVSGDSFPDDAEAIDDDENNGRLLRLRDTSNDANSTSISNVPRNLQGKIVIDVMVLWSENAECRQNGKDIGCTLSTTTIQGMKGLVNLAIHETNVAYQNSGINVELQLVHSQRLSSYKEPSSNAFTHSLSYVKGNSEVRSLRDEYGADLVHFMIDDPQYCGVANLGPREDLAYSITNYRCATGYYSFGHELAHSMGSNHDRGASSRCGKDGINYGYRDPNARFRSIMAYSCRSGQCDNNAGGGCARVQQFSSASHRYNGHKIGDQENDNASHINNVAAQVAAFRTRPSQAPPPVPQPTPVPAPPAPAGCQSGDVPLEFTITTDKFPEDLTWEIRRSDNVLIHSVSEYAMTAEEETFTYPCSVQNARYKFSLTDGGKDGLCCKYTNQGAGKMSLKYGDSYIFQDLADFGDGYEAEFGSIYQAPPSPSSTSCNLGKRGDACFDDESCCKGYVCADDRECKAYIPESIKKQSKTKVSQTQQNPWDRRKMLRQVRRSSRKTKIN